MVGSGDTAVTSVTEDDLLRLRINALRLSAVGSPGVSDASGTGSVAGVARHMLALQGQDWRSSRWALGVRAPGNTVADVAEAFRAGDIVRSWPMRGTIHVVAAEDIGWMQRLTNHRVLSGAQKRRDFLGMSDAVLDRLVETSLAAIAEQPRDRDGLTEVWNEAGIEWKPMWRYHTIWWLCQNGLAVFGPTDGEREPLLVPAETWIRTPRHLEGDDALVELSHRYTAARGAVRAKDLAWWSGLTVTEAKRGIALARDSGRLVPVRLRDAAGDAVSGAAGELWADPAALESMSPAAAASAPAEIPDWLLLPAFDEHLLGYSDRSPQLDPAHLERIIPGKNGMFLATVVHRGRVVGTWKRGTRKGAGPEFTALPRCTVDAAALAPAVERWTAFHAG